MKIIAENDDGFILDASKEEIEGILKATGVKKPEPKTGDVVAVANYIEAEKTASNFVNSYPVERMQKAMKKLNNQWNKVERILNEED